MIEAFLEIHQKLTLVLVVLIFAKLLGLCFIILFEKKQETSITDKTHSRIDIIVAAYNEGRVIIKTINNLLKIDYEDFKILVVDDGSEDNTLKLLNLHYENHPKIKILSKINKGKAKALTYALTHSSAEIVAFIDADTQIQSNILKIISSSFKDELTVALSGYLKVQNLCNMLTIGQHIEYITTFNLEREIFEKMATLTTIPGAICAYRRKSLLEVGGFDNETITEDCDVTLKLLRANLKVRNEKKMIAYTEAPETVRMFIRQRTRWDYGLMQNLLKHGSYKYNTNYRIILVFFYSWIYKIGYTLLFAMADYLFLILLIIGNEVYYYIYFLTIETLLFLVVIKKEIKVVKFNVLFFIFYRIPYRHLKFFSLAIAIFKIVRKEKIQWKKINRIKHS